MKKLLLVGSDTVHTYNYLDMAKGHFEDCLLIVQKGGKQRETGVRTVEIDFSMRNPFSFSRTVKMIRQHIKEFSPSVIHAHQAAVTSYAALKAADGCGIPTIVTAWGSDILILPHTGWLYKKMVQYNLQKADYFTSDSLYMAAEMHRLVPGRQLDITIANFGTNIALKDVPKENIVYSNRLHKSLYRIDKIIEAFAAFYPEGKKDGWKLVVAATGEKTEELKQLASKLGISEAVSFPGWVTPADNSDYYNRAKLFVSIPESDATSISLLEAMAAGCIPVLSNLPANLEWVLDGINGVIVDNVQGNFLNEALKIDHKRASALNKQIISEKGTREVNTKKFLALYERALALRARI